MSKTDSTCGVNPVFTVDVHHPNSKRPKRRNKIHNGTREKRQNEEGDNQSLSNCNLQPGSDQSVTRPPQYSRRTRLQTFQEVISEERQQFERVTRPESHDCYSTMVDNTRQQGRTIYKAHTVMETYDQVITVTTVDT